jgi:DNA excision repair protein ERCC-5
MIKILMICNLWLPVKSRKLEELAEQIRGERAKHEAKGKQVGSSREGQNENTNQDQNQNGDTNNRGSSREGQNENTNQDQNQNGDTNNSEGTNASINQEKMDEMYVSSCKFLCFLFLVKVRELIFILLVLGLAASLAAEEEKGFTGEGKHFTSVPLQEGPEIDEDDDDDGGMVFVRIFSQLNLQF